jgi:transposase
MWCVAQLDDQFIERMEDVLDLYAKPYDQKEPVICLDEKSVQLLDHTHPPIPGKVTKVDHEYIRCGTVNIFSAFEPLQGNPILEVTDRRTAHDFALFLVFVASLYPRCRTIHLVMDNLNTHRLKSLVETFGARKGTALWNKFTVHHTPKHASWLNQAELLLSAVSRACLRKTRHPSKTHLRKALRAWRKRHKHFRTNWRFSVVDAKACFKYT